jgi:hypothetical protein
VAVDEEITKTILLMMGINVSLYQETPQARFLLNWIRTTNHRHVPPKKWKRHPQQKHHQKRQKLLVETEVELKEQALAVVVDVAELVAGVVG